MYTYILRKYIHFSCMCYTRKRKFFRTNERIGETEINLNDRDKKQVREKFSTFSTTTPYSRYCNEQ